MIRASGKAHCHCLRWAPQPVVLLLEADKDVSELLDEWLQTDGFKVLVSKDAAAALDMLSLSNQRVDLLLAETTTPGMGVQALYNSLFRLNPGMKVLFMSGTLDARFARMLGDQVERLFLLKPFTREALLEKIRNCLG